MGMNIPTAVASDGKVLKVRMLVGMSVVQGSLRRDKDDFNESGKVMSSILPKGPRGREKILGGAAIHSIGIGLWLSGFPLKARQISQGL